MTQNDPGLEHHKLGVVGYLEYAFSQAPLPSNTTTGNSTGNSTGNLTSGNSTGSGFAGGASTAGPTLSFGNSLPGSTLTSSNSTSRVSWGYPPNAVDVGNPYLSFRVDDDDPLLVWDSGPRPPATAWLYFKDGEGLSIIWQTDQQKLIDPTALQRTIISPLVTKLDFVYYDATSEEWTTSDTPQTDPTSGAQLLPNFLRLTFKINGKEEIMTVNLPGNETTVPIY